MVHMENQWRHHGYHASVRVNTQAALAAAVRGGLLIALQADVFATEEVRYVVDMVPGKAMALQVVTAVGRLRSSTSAVWAVAVTPRHVMRPSGLMW